MKKEISFKEAVDIVFNKLSKLSKKEFRQLLKKHKDGDIAKILRKVGYVNNDLTKLDIEYKVKRQLEEIADIWVGFAENILKNWNSCPK